MIKAVIFDLDGVLESSNRTWIALYRDIARKVGISKALSDDEITREFGQRYEVVLQGIVGEERIVQAMQLLDEALASNDWVQAITPAPHSKDVLETLKRGGTKLGVVSGNTRPVLDISLTMLGIKDFFETIVSADDVARTKPDPEGLIRALQELDVPAAQAIYVGDAANDVKAAKAAGMAVAVVLTGALTRRRAESLKPNAIMPDLRGILTII